MRCTLCENNGYAEATAVDYHLNTETIADMACAYAMPSERADGMDIVTVVETARRAVKRVRSGEGPMLLEFVSYRFSGQYEGDPQTYQPPEEIAEAKRRDPLRLFRVRAGERGLEDERLNEIEEQVGQRIDAAFRAAERAPWPSPEDLFDDVYVSYPRG